MPRYRLRTLLILLAIGPPLLAGAWLMVMTIVSRYSSPYGNTAPYGNYIQSEKEKKDTAEFNKLIDEVEAFKENPDFPNTHGLEIITD